MTSIVSKHDGTNIIIEIPGVGVTLAAGATVPTDNDDGYAHGCLFIHTDGTAYNDALYCNIGTRADCNFNVVTVAQ